MKQKSYFFSLLPAALLLVFAAPAFAQYGIGVTQQVPYVAPDAITLDGNADEAAWSEAPILDLTQYWNSGYYDCAPNAPEGGVDIAVLGRLLHTDGALYVLIQVQDYQEFYWGPPGEPYQGEQLLVGVDLTHEGDDQVDDTYSGWPQNAPNFGPTTYKISGAPDVGITHNWGFDNIFPADSGWVAGETFVDNSSFRWGIEMAVYGDEIATGEQIGFNIGGAAATEDCYEMKEDAGYAYYSWQALANGSAGGDVMNNAASFATLNFVEGVGIEENAAAQGFALSSSFPNPFRSATTIEYTLERAAEVEVAVYDLLGRKVATLAEGAQAAGTARVTWDATGLPTGLYIGQLRVNGEVVGVQKMQLIH